MSYKIGVSSGWWKIAKAPELVGLATKVGGFGATSGVQFVQADLDTTSEFYEPQLKERLKRIKKELGMEVGLHAEVGELMSIEAAEKRLWVQSHLRLVETVKNAADLGIVFINMHPCTKPQLEFLEAQYRVTGYYYPVVSFDGRPLYTLCEKNNRVKEVATNNMSQVSIDDEVRHRTERRLMREANERALKRLQEFEKKNKISADAQRQSFLESFGNEERRTANDIFHSPAMQYQMWKESTHGKFLTRTAEIAAYEIVGTYMKETGDPLWSHFCGSSDAATAYIDKHPQFNAAIACKYIQGHLTVKDHPINIKHLNGMSIIEWLKKSNIKLLFETPEAHEGNEGLIRLFNPIDIYELIKVINSPFVKLCIDFEHVLGHKINPDEMIKEAPNDFGKYIELFHLGRPIPYWGTAHIPLQISSRSQEIIYRWLYAMRQKGWKDGYMIYERGGGKTPAEVMGQGVWVMRQIKKYLEMDIKPDKLPSEFFGVSEENEDVYRRQLVTMREHAWDPLEGVLAIPEEKHTFLSKTAVDKGKKEEWLKRGYR